MKAVLCYLQPCDTPGSMWLAAERPPEHEEIDSIEVDVPEPLFRQMQQGCTDTVTAHATLQHLWERAGSPNV